MQTVVYVRLSAPARGFLCFAACCAALLAQTSATQTPAPLDPATSPLAPVEERDQAIRQYDPLDQADAAARARADREAEKRRQEDRRPTPGSIADSQTDGQIVPRRSGPQVLDDTAESTAQEYTGPAVLSRNYSINQAVLTKGLNWSESIFVGTSFDTGLGQIATNGSPASTGQLQGTQIGYSLSGGHAFGHDSLHISYSGSMAYYPGSSFYTGSNGALSASYSHVVSRRISTGLSFSGSQTSANAALLNPSVGPGTIANVNLATSPDIAVFDTGSKQGSLAANLSWQLTSRTSFSFNGSYFGVLRNSAALNGMSGEQTGVSGNYRLTRKTTVGASYSFSQYVYPHGIETSDSQSVSLIYSYALSRSTQLRFNGGVSRTESLGLQVVPINPIIAALLGQTSGVIDAYRSFRGTNLSAQVIHDFHKGSTLSLSYARGITPGNGLFQTSQQESIASNAGIKLFRTYGLSIGAGRDRIVSVTQNLGQYVTEYATVSMARSYKKGLGVNFSLNYRHFEIATLGNLRDQLSVSSGFSWSSSRLWPF
jgi:hypothetical protein